MRLLFLLVLVSLGLGSCTINKDLLFKTPKDYVFDTLPDTLNPPARLAPNNMLNFNFFTGDGHILVEAGLGSNMFVSQGQNMRSNQLVNQQNQLPYIIDRDGTVKLPVVGRVKLAGLTLREAEQMLEKLYEQYYNDPFVLLNVQNNRVIISPGAGGAAAVITLVNNNTTLMEALAMAGGVSQRGDASKVKLIRSDDQTNERKVYQFDLSTIEGIKYADVIVQPNDIIYVEPLPLLTREFLQEITPLVTLLSTVAILISLVSLN